MRPELGLHDPLNLKELITEHLTKILKKNKKLPKLQTTQGFIEALWNGVDSVDCSSHPAFSTKSGNREFTLPTYKDLQKLMSGNISVERFSAFTAMIHDGLFDAVFRENLRPVAEAIQESDQEGHFFNQLVNEVDLRYFSINEVTQIRNQLTCKDYTGLLVGLICHGLETLENLPIFYGQRIYQEALTIDYDLPLRYNLFKEAANCGIEEAALEYANYVAKRPDSSAPLTDREMAAIEEAIHYFLMAKSYSPSLWNIAFFLEKYRLPKKLIKEVSKQIRISSKLTAINPELIQHELNIIMPSEDVEDRESILLAYKLHFYNAYKRNGYAKSFNSLRNMLFDGKVVPAQISGFTREDLIEKYRNMSVKRQDIFGIINQCSKDVEIFLQKRKANESYPKIEEITLERMLEASANARADRALYNLALFRYQKYLDCKNQEKQPEQRYGYTELDELKYLLHDALAANIKMPRLQAELYYRLGMLENDAVKKQINLEKAAKLGHSEANYELSLLHHHEQDIN